MFISFAGQFVQDLPPKMRVLISLIRKTLYFEDLQGLILVNSRRFAFWRRSGALYFEGLRGLILVNSREFAF